MSQRLSVWLAGEDRPRYDPLLGRLGADVVVVGAGITGLTAAVLLAQAGAKVCVLEGARVASGTTGGTTGKVTSQHGLIYRRLIDEQGIDLAKAYADANQSAIDLVESLVQASEADCGFTRTSAFVYALDDDEALELMRENEATQSLGLPSRLTSEGELPFPVAGLFEFTGQAYLHPVRYCDALASYFIRLGGRLFEGTRVSRLRESRDGVEVSGGFGAVAARHAVVATLLPFIDRGGFFARTRPWRAYGVAALVRNPAPRGMYIGASGAGRSFRPWPEAGEQGIIFVGESHQTGDETASPSRWGDLERWAREHFEVESFEYRWSAQDYDTADGLPFVGRSPLTHKTFVATGFRKWGLSNGTAAGGLITDLILGAENVLAHHLRPFRTGGLAAVGRTIADNVEVLGYYVNDQLRRLGAIPLATLAPGEGALVEVDGVVAAAYRDPAGEIKAVSPTCTHLRCTVRWNDAEKTWDCHCHGSRFDTDGIVLNGPATTPLAQIDLTTPEVDPV